MSNAQDVAVGPVGLLGHAHLSAGLIDRLVGAVHAAPDAARTTTTAPFTGEPLFSLPVSTEVDVADAFVVARSAQLQWAARPVRERTQIVGRLHHLLLDRQSEVLDLLQLECGKARFDGYAEVFAAAVAARYYSRSALGLLGVKRRRGLIPGATRAFEARQPKGVVGLATAWNFPIVFAGVDGFPALVAGNSIVHRPDYKGAMSVLWLRSLAIEAGLPEGLWQVVLGPGRVVGNAVTDHADYVAFTGSTEVGRQVAERAGRRLIGCSLELGGKNPLLVLVDADVEKAAAGAVRATFTNTGQACVGTERILVAVAVYDRFVAAFLSKVRRLRVGTGLSFEYDMGSLIDQAQLDRSPGTSPTRWRKVRPCCTRVAHVRTSARSSTNRRCWPASATACGCATRRRSARWCLSNGSTPRTRPWPPRTTPHTAWRPRSGPATRATLAGWPSGCAPAESTSTSTTRPPGSASTCPRAG